MRGYRTWDYIAAHYISDYRNWMTFDSVVGGCETSDEEAVVFFPELSGSIDIDRQIDRKKYFLSMSEEAKIIIKFLLFGEEKTIRKHCSTPKTKRISKVSTYAFFKKKWGRKKVVKAFQEISRYLKI